MECCIGATGSMSEARGYAASLQDAGLFFWVYSQGCTLGWYVLPL